jgi:hypothetical protein
MYFIYRVYVACKLRSAASLDDTNCAMHTDKNVSRIVHMHSYEQMCSVCFMYYRRTLSVRVIQCIKALSDWRRWLSCGDVARSASKGSNQHSLPEMLSASAVLDSYASLRYVMLRDTQTFFSLELRAVIYSNLHAISPPCAIITGDTDLLLHAEPLACSILRLKHMLTHLPQALCTLLTSCSSDTCH